MMSFWNNFRNGVLFNERTEEVILSVKATVHYSGYFLLAHHRQFKLSWWSELKTERWDEPQEYKKPHVVTSMLAEFWDKLLPSSIPLQDLLHFQFFESRTREPKDQEVLVVSRRRETFGFRWRFSFGENAHVDFQEVQPNCWIKPVVNISDRDREALKEQSQLLQTLVDIVSIKILNWNFNLFYQFNLSVSRDSYGGQSSRGK